MRLRMLIVALTAVGALLFLLAGNSIASSKHDSHSQGSSWTDLGGNPVVPGGLLALGNGNARFGYFKLMTGADGASAMKHAGLNRAARRAFAHSATKGHFRSCLLKYGSHHLKMSFGPHGMFVDTNVTFKDPRYKHHPAPAFCDHVQVSKKTTITRGQEVLVKTVVNDDGSTDLYYDRTDSVTSKTCFVDSLVPVACGNFAVERFGCASSVRLVHHRRHVHVPPPPSYACTDLQLSASTIQPGDSVTATVTYTANGATFQSVNYSWGDSTTSNGGTSKSHVFNTAGLYTVTGTVNFVLPNGSHVSATADACSKPLTVSLPPSMSAVMNSIQEVYNNGEIYPNLWGMLNSPVGDTIECKLSVVNETKDGPGAGSIQDPKSYTFTSTGNGQIVGTWVYVAPNDNGGSASVGLNNWLKLVCTDLSNSKVKPATAYSLEFPVMETPTRP